LKLVIASVLVLAMLRAFVPAQVTQRVSVSSTGTQGNNVSEAVSITPDGRYVAYYSSANTLVPGDTNGTQDVFVRDRASGTTERVSVNSSGIQGNGQSNGGWLSQDGRFVSFSSWATNLVPGDTNTTQDAFVHDCLTGTTELVSINSSGVQANDYCFSGPTTPNGRYVVLVLSYASNLVVGDTNARSDVFVRDRQGGITERVSVGSFGVQGNNDSYGGSISADGRYVAFTSYASNLVSGDSNGSLDVFVRDRQSGTTERVSVNSAGAQGGGESHGALISDDGRYVSFVSDAANLISGDLNSVADAFVRDRQLGTTERVSLTSIGMQANGESDFARMSADGRYVSFTSDATNLVPGDTNGVWDIFLRDRTSDTTERISINSAGVGGDSYSLAAGFPSADGRYVAFSSGASNLVPGDSNAIYDAFVRDRLGGTSFTSICHPGTAGVIGCPCSNMPSGVGRGCDNSSSTGGAVLSAAGGTYLSSDSLVFTASDERPTALSIVAQWNGRSATGTVFGMGVRCTSGTLKRLYTKLAVGGIITAPDFGSGDLQVSARSAVLGDEITPGRSRWYLVYYRDPNVLGGCPAMSTFNSTQTGEVTWFP
jgi:archaellum component FlaF (FlaF/FlaG flagellin family)